MQAERKSGGAGEWLGHKAAAPAVITCVRLKKPFFEDACVWDTTDLENKNGLKLTLA